MKAGEGENAQTYGFVYVPLKNRDDEHNDDEDIEKTCPTGYKNRD